jgi:hypothetical protein
MLQDLRSSTTRQILPSLRFQGVSKVIAESSEWSLFRASHGLTIAQVVLKNSYA